MPEIFAVNWYYARKIAGNLFEKGYNWYVDGLLLTCTNN